jgi:hypothetical protein
MDFYAGFKKELIGPGFASDIGVLAILLPNFRYTQYRWLCKIQIQLKFMQRKTLHLGRLSGFVKFSYAVSRYFWKR